MQKILGRRSAVDDLLKPKSRVSQSLMPISHGPDQACKSDRGLEESTTYEAKIGRMGASQSLSNSTHNHRWFR